MSRNMRLTALLLSLAAGPLALAAEEKLDKALDKGELRATQAAEAQNKVDAVYDETRTRSDEYKGVLKEIEGLQVYIGQVQAQVSNQERELAEIANAVGEVQVFDRQVVPLMLRMIDALDQFVALDVPFLKAERSERVERMRKLLGRADVTVPEKFRNVMTAYSTEVNYGSTIEAYRGKLDDGREVDFLRVGRIALLYRTLDGLESGRWSSGDRNYAVLPRSYNSHVLQGIRIAREQAAPDLIHVPVNTAEALP